MRTRRRPCLDLAHRFPDMTCATCTRGRHDGSDIIAAARRRHARTIAEESW
ncbi:hypothetical protein ACPPVO_07090 [Dactylosporangium sp. McL0621]|uniref:hypothetical protein n=1 Tax=Dactylosporangium sp. McL0621 TaxID=3415678 RepID=UPI003CF13F6B